MQSCVSQDPRPAPVLQCSQCYEQSRIKTALLIWMRDGNFSHRSEINQHLQLYNNFFIQRFSQPDNEQINTREGCCFSWGTQYRSGRRIPRIRREGNRITFSPNSASAMWPNEAQMLNRSAQWWTPEEFRPDKVLQALFDFSWALLGQFYGFHNLAENLIYLEVCPKLWWVLWTGGTGPTMSYQYLELDC